MARGFQKGDKPRDIAAAVLRVLYGMPISGPRRARPRFLNLEILPRSAPGTCLVFVGMYDLPLRCTGRSFLSSRPPRKVFPLPASLLLTGFGTPACCVPSWSGTFEKICAVWRCPYPNCARSCRYQGYRHKNAGAPRCLAPPTLLGCSSAIVTSTSPLYFTVRT